MSKFIKKSELELTNDRKADAKKMLKFKSTKSRTISSQELKLHFIKNKYKYNSYLCNKCKKWMIIARDVKIVPRAAGTTRQVQ
jgi:hypothetical protein